MTPWDLLAAELAAWRDAGRTPRLWWRDDDAAAATPALAQLILLSRKCEVPLALAVIPQLAEAHAIAEASCVILHGCDHRNRAAAGEKKTEFAATEAADAALARLARARERLASLAGASFVPALAPPWNRFRHDLIERLPQAGIHGMSRYGARSRNSQGVREVNTHVDIIDWRGSRAFVGEDAALALLVGHLSARRRGEADAAEPTGVLTHHAVHDPEAWRFLERLFGETRAAGAAWADPRQLFALAA
jgi:peptidoglycan/xylan/chitin deacetylase (PgdA/CDA1 family)